MMKIPTSQLASSNNDAHDGVRKAGRSVLPRAADARSKRQIIVVEDDDMESSLE